jgi:hypothetical protein
MAEKKRCDDFVVHHMGPWHVYKELPPCHLCNTPIREDDWHVRVFFNSPLIWDDKGRYKHWVLCTDHDWRDHIDEFV